jgi:hypothetical protein
MHHHHHPSPNLLRQATDAQQEAHKLTIAIQRSFDGLRSVRNVASCLITRGGGRGAKGAKGGDSGRCGGNP